MESLGLKKHVADEFTSLKSAIEKEVKSSPLQFLMLTKKEAFTANKCRSTDLWSVFKMQHRSDNQYFNY